MSLGTGEILTLLAIGLIVLGPEKLPRVAKKIARTLREFRQYADDMKRDISRDLLVDDKPISSYIPPLTDDSETDFRSDYGYGYGASDAREEEPEPESAAVTEDSEESGPDGASSEECMDGNTGSEDSSTQKPAEKHKA